MVWGKQALGLSGPLPLKPPQSSVLTNLFVCVPSVYTSLHRTIPHPATASSCRAERHLVECVILVRFLNPLAFGSQTGTLSRFYPFNWSKLNGSLYIDESGAQVKMCRLYGRTSIKIDGKNSDAARISNLCAGSSIAAAHSVEVKLRIDSLTVAAKRQPHNVQ